MSIPSWFHPGAKVVAVKETDDGLHGDYAIPLNVGQIYTIDEVEEVEWSSGTAVIGSVVESEPLDEDGMLWPYRIDCFRPLISRTQESDISTYFKDLLRVGEDA